MTGKIVIHINWSMEGGGVYTPTTDLRDLHLMLHCT